MAAQLFARATATFSFLPSRHISALEAYVHTLAPSQSSPIAAFHLTFLALHNIVDSILRALARPAQLITQITAARREVERSYSSMSRSSRWPLGLLDDARQRLNEEREEKAKRSQAEARELAKELRYTQQTVAGELAGWRDMHEKIGRRAITDLARGMLVAERMRLTGMQRTLRKVKVLQEEISPPSSAHESEEDGASQQDASGDALNSVGAVVVPPSQEGLELQ